LVETRPNPDQTLLSTAQAALAEDRQRLPAMVPTVPRWLPPPRLLPAVPDWAAGEDSAEVQAWSMPR
jgi:hypothetical protein